MSKQVLDSLDRKILKLISQDARIPFLEVARACNVSGAAIHQRVAKLTNLGIIKGSQFIIDPEKIGYETCAYVGLYLKNPENFDKVVAELKKFQKWWNVIIRLVAWICSSRYMLPIIIIFWKLFMISSSL